MFTGPASERPALAWRAGMKAAKTMCADSGRHHTYENSLVLCQDIFAGRALRFVQGSLQITRKPFYQDFQPPLAI